MKPKVIVVMPAYNEEKRVINTNLKTKNNEKS
jgi:glycosyltransferase involved in cell wall biosynthesis